LIMDRLSSDQMPSAGFSSGAYAGSRNTRSHAVFASAKSVSSGARWMLRLSHFCARPCYVASGGWQSLSPAVMGWAVPWPAT
jgi:hypothetical protein